jgi:hypothetical protein
MAARPVGRTSAGRRGQGALGAAGLRQLHAYIGAFIAPSVLFFAATGALQLFSLHEAHGGYTPPPLIVKLSAVHKDQRFAAKSDHDGAGPPAGPHADDGAKADAHHDHDDGDAPSARTVALKWLFLAVSLGLMISTVVGVWMAVSFSRRKGVVWALLVLGTALPILILAL